MQISILASPRSNANIPPDQIADALQSRFPRVKASIPVSNLVPGDLLLVIGWGPWAQPDIVEQLQAAGSKGVQRVLWQCEVLPPPVEGLARTLIRTDLHRARGRWNKRSLVGRKSGAAFDLAASVVLAGLIRRANTTTADFCPTSRSLRYPLRQARDISALWRERLLDHIIVSVAPRKAFLAQLGIPSQFVPVGYIPAFGSEIPGIARDIDVLFLGRISDRRRELLASVQEYLHRHNRKLLVVDRECYGEARTQLLNRSRIILNLQNFPWEFPLVRLLMAMSCKALVVSERASDPGPFTDGRHLVVSDVGDLGPALIKYLDDEAKRSQIVGAAHEYVTSVFTMERLLTAALESIVSRSEAERANG